MSTPDDAGLEYLRKRQIAVVQCLEALRALKYEEQLRVLVTVGAFYDVTRWASVKGE